MIDSLDNEEQWNELKLSNDFFFLLLMWTDFSEPFVLVNFDLQHTDEIVVER